MKKLWDYVELPLNLLAYIVPAYVITSELLRLVISNNIIVIVISVLIITYLSLNYYTHKLELRVSSQGIKKTILGTGISLYSFGRGPWGSHYVEFQCRRCMEFATGDPKLGRNYVTFLYLPLIPLALSAYTYCSKCLAVLFLGKREKNHVISIYNSHMSSRLHIGAYAEWPLAALYTFGGMILGYFSGRLISSIEIIYGITLSEVILAVLGMASGSNLYTNKAFKRTNPTTTIATSLDR